ncbi:MAG: hypothetical protein C5B51_05050 [Terriglobia bacterium]|nr:MAG: hypothetical protein C5B51_05050 [Terriglobia bacterium]
MRQKVLATTFLLFSTVLAGCGGGYGYNYRYVSYGPPPPRYYGAIGVAPGPGYVWTNGYWAWRGGRYDWMDGRWVRPPRGRTAWIEGRWDRDGRGWAYRPGHWR